MSAVDRTAAPASYKMDIRSYGSRLARSLSSGRPEAGPVGLAGTTWMVAQLPIQFSNSRFACTTVIAIEAKQSIVGAASRKLDCFVASLLAMTRGKHEVICPSGRLVDPIEPFQT